MFQSAFIEEEIDRLAINSKHPLGPISTINASNTSNLNTSNISQNTPSSLISNPTHVDSSKLCALLAIALDANIKLWLVSDESSTILIGNFCLNSVVDNLFFIGSQLVAVGAVGKIGVWNSLSQLWQHQDINPISSFDTAGSFLLLGN